jgi:hypothetical protein
MPSRCLGRGGRRHRRRSCLGWSRHRLGSRSGVGNDSVAREGAGRRRLEIRVEGGGRASDVDREGDSGTGPGNDDSIKVVIARPMRQ